jgi:recombination associated protein RdgC
VGAFSGPLTLSKLFVRGQLPADFKKTAPDRIRLRAFAPLEPDAEVEESLGWAVVSSPLDLELDHEKVFFGSYVNLALRIDRYRLPPALVQAHFQEACREALVKGKREALSKADKKELLARVSLRLKKRVLPSMIAFDFSWNLDTMVAYFWSQSAKAIERLSAHFETTFGLELVTNSPYMAARERSLNETQLRALDAVESTPLHAARKTRETREVQEAREE